MDDPLGDKNNFDEGLPTNDTRTDITENLNGEQKKDQQKSD